MLHVTIGSVILRCANKESKTGKTSLYLQIIYLYFCITPEMVANCIFVLLYNITYPFVKKLESKRIARCGHVYRGTGMYLLLINPKYDAWNVSTSYIKITRNNWLLMNKIKETHWKKLLVKVTRKTSKNYCPYNHDSLN